MSTQSDSRRRIVSSTLNRGVKGKSFKFFPSIFGDDVIGPTDNAKDIEKKVQKMHERSIYPFCSGWPPCLEPTLMVSLEGGIAMGKSKILEALSVISPLGPDCHVYLEPVKEWETPEAPGKDSVLEACYKDPKNAYPLQKKVLFENFKRAVDIKEFCLDNPRTWVVQERSFQAAREVFLAQNKRHINPDLVENLEKSSEFLERHFEEKLLKIGVVVPVEVGWSRVQKRGREAERQMSKEFYYTNWALHNYYVWNKCHYVLEIPATEEHSPTPEYLACLISVLVGFYILFFPVGDGKHANRPDYFKNSHVGPFPKWVRRTNVPFHPSYLEQNEQHSGNTSYDCRPLEKRIKRTLATPRVYYHKEIPDDDGHDDAGEWC